MENKSEYVGIGAWAIMNRAAYIQIPKTLVECAPIIGVNLAAVLCYSMMIDRAKLSAENGLFDDMGRVYIYFTRKELCDITGWSRKKTSDVYAILQSVGLIEEKIMKNRAGCNTKTRIFVRAWDVMVTDIWRREVHVEEFPFLDKDSIKIQQSFYALPRDLLQRKNLNTKAKLLYAIALDLVALSEANGWRDDIGIWAELDAKKLQALLQCGHSSLSAAYQALQEADLIYRQKRECGMPMRTYLCSLKTSNKVAAENFNTAEYTHQLSANQITNHPKIAPQSCECAHQTILIDSNLYSLPYGVSLTGDAAKGAGMIEVLDVKRSSPMCASFVRRTKRKCRLWFARWLMQCVAMCCQRLRLYGSQGRECTDRA